MDSFGGLGGCYDFQTASEVRSELRFEISDLDYLHIYVHIAYLLWTLFTASEVTMASKQPRRSDRTFDYVTFSMAFFAICDPFYLRFARAKKQCGKKIRPLISHFGGSLARRVPQNQ